MKLYSHPLSLFSAKVRIALSWKGLQYDLIDVPLDPARGYQPKHPQVVAHNPKQQVPLLVDGELALYDSTVILEFLEDIAAEPPLYPDQPRARARCRQLELEADEVFFPPLGLLIQRRYARAAGAPDDPTERSGVEIASSAHYHRLARQLGDSPYLCESLSVADIAHFLVTCFAQGFGMAIPSELTNLRRWFERVAAEPVIARELAVMHEARQKLEARS